LNHDKLGSYDKIKAGMNLTVYERAGDGLAKAAPAAPSEPPAPEFEEKAATPVQASTDSGQQPPAGSAPPVQSAVAPAPAEAPLPFDPIPDTPPAAALPVATAPAPAPVTEMPKKAPELPKSVAVGATNAAEGLSSTIAGNTNYRRMLYIGLIIMIAGAAFFLTRPASKKKFDMLDATATETSVSRPKLAKDSQDQFVG
jgi:hypothetical protein